MTMRLVLVGAGVLVVAFQLGGCRGWDTTPAVIPPADLPAATLTNLRMTSSHAGVTDWVLTAPAAEGDPNAGLEVRAPHVDVMNADGSRAAWADAGSARVNRVSQDVWARAGVRIHARDGLVVETDSLQLMSGAHRLVTAARVRVSRGGSRLTGVGFDSDSSLRTYKILGKLEAHVVDSSGDLHVD